MFRRALSLGRSLALPLSAISSPSRALREPPSIAPNRTFQHFVRPFFFVLFKNYSKRFVPSPALDPSIPPSLHPSIPRSNPFPARNSIAPEEPGDRPARAVDGRDRTVYPLDIEIEFKGRRTGASACVYAHWDAHSGAHF